VKKRPLESNGERIEIDISNNKINFNQLDFYQKSHYRRYEFALTVLTPAGITGDFACGSGYGSVMLSQKSTKVIGMDINQHVVEQIAKRYGKIENVEFVQSNLLNLTYTSLFDNIVSFETIEHLKEEDIPDLFKAFSRALKPGGRLIFSTPYMQERSPEAVDMGFHLTFDIDEKTINKWLMENGLQAEIIKYQNYEDHIIEDNIEKKDFIICVARKL
jgi:2-polyprenyl-3-methyl-5-hydroxy-6-metoxy-1,4-benzoquinol methylase